MGKDDTVCPGCGDKHDGLTIKCYSCLCKDYQSGAPRSLHRSKT